MTATSHGDGPRIRCRGCGDCCRTVRVPLTHRDLERLIAASGLAAAAIAEWLAPDDIDMTGEPGSFVRLRPGRRLLVLRHLGGGCRFLEGDRCSVYAARPRCCAAFPHDLDESGVGAPAVVGLDGAPCRIASPPDEAAVRDGILALQAELVEYLALVGAYNRRQRRRERLGRLAEPAERFLAFLGGAHAPAPATRPPAPAEDGSAGSRASDPR